MRTPAAGTATRTGKAIAETTATLLLCLAAIVGPLALGGTHPLAIAGLTVVMAVVISLWAIFQRPRPMQVAVPLACFILPWLQLVPLPDRLLGAIAPLSANAWKAAHAEMADAWGQVSMDPAETAAAARRGFLAVGTAAAVASLSLRPRHRNCLVAAMAVSGGVIWTLGLAFPVKLHSFLLLGAIGFQGPLMPGRTPLEPPPATAGFGFPEMVRVVGQQYAADSWVVGDGFGPYLVTNHFAGALTLTIPFLVAGWLVVSRRRLPPWLRHTVAASLFGGAAFTLGALVQSRAGTASFVLAMLVFTCFSAPAGRLRWLMAAATLGFLVIVAGFSAVLYGLFDGVGSLLPVRFQPQFAALQSDSRIAASRAAMRVFVSSPLVGTGLGTFGDLYPTMVRDGIPLYFAHNEYAQLLSETGVSGAAVAVILLVLLVTSALRCWEKSSDAERTLGAGAWAAVAGILLHSCFDWNLRVPANCFFTCIASGLALVSGATAVPQRLGTRPGGFECRAVAVALVLAAVVAAVFQIRDTASELTQRQIRSAIVAARRHAADPEAPSPQAALEAAVAAGERMTAWDPGDAQLAVALGQAYLHLASLPVPIDAANASIERAADAFRLARRNCAACRGLAEAQPFDLPREGE